MSAVNAMNANKQASSELLLDKAEQPARATKDARQAGEAAKPVDQVSFAEKMAQAEQDKKNIEKEAVAMTPDQLEKVAQQLQDFMGEMNRSLEFTVDKDSGRDVIKVLDKGSGELVKQYPSEEVLTLISKLSDATGNLIDTKI